MLHRSFKPVKCKTSLKLATSRLKLMKNKKGVQLNHMKRDLAQLLQSGQDQTARIRVEHVIREEKMITAFDLIEIYCELIAARLPIIESQKNCPIDLKEAITSVIFASPRCAEIPELLDIRKHFTAKYGKEFISRAIELRPDCGVSRMLIDKLSAVAPNGQTKMKVLGAIAEEHNIKWEPKSFGEKDTEPPDDLLKGWNTSQKTTKMLAESPKFQTPNVQALPIRDQNHDEPLKFSEQNIRSSLGSQNSASTAACGINTEVSSTSRLDVRPSGMASGVMEMRQSFPGEGNSALSGRQNWNMDFKDALSAAQAAAESAEQASMAARAAAELSNIHALRDERPGKYAASNLRGERPANDSVGNSFYDRNPGLKKEQIDWNEHDDLVGAAERFHWDGHGHGHSEESSRSPSSRSSETSIEDDTLVNSIQKVNGCSKKSSFKGEVIKPENPFSSGVSMKRPSRESGVGCGSGQNDGFKSENSDYFGEESSFSGDYSASNSNHWKFGSDAAEDPFGDIDQESIHRETIKMNSYDDDSSSDSDGGRFDMGPKYDEEEFPSYFSSSGRKSPTHFPPLSTSNGDNRVSQEKSSSQPHYSAEWHSPLEFSESLVQSIDHSQSENFVPVTFDYSDGPKFDSEEDMEKSWPSGTKDSDTLPREHDVFSLNLEPTDCHCSHGLTGSLFLEKANSGSDRGPWLHTSSDDSDAMEVGQMKNQGTELSIDYPKESKEEPHTQMASKEVKYFDSDTGDSEEDLPKQTSTNTGLSGCGRRTKASPSSSETASYSRIEIGSSKASAAEQQNTVASSSNENPKTSSLRGQTSSGENNGKNASHVHPKLPDYDVVAAHLQSLMRNRE